MEPKKILVVDDEEDIRNLLKLVLADRGHSVSAAANGPEALWMILREKPDLVILDLLMPQMSGEQVCRLIKSDPALRDIIVFILSARSDLEAKLNCLAIGAEEYLVKPIDMEELGARVDRFFGMLEQWRINPAVTAHRIDQTAKTLTLDRGAESTKDLGLRTNDTETLKKSSPASKHRAKYGVYRIENLAGTGGMGFVYKAHDDVLDRYVAVKVLSKRWSNSVEFLDRFHREARLIAAINHPGIAQIFTLGEEEGESYFALEWCPGGSLAHLIRRERRIGLLPALDMLVQSARALMAASTKGVVHRDIKPSNIMFDQSHQIKIVDFGVASSDTLSAHITVAEEILGSPAYMAPEQAQRASVDHRADIYSLGVTFYQMLYGKLPYSAKSPVEWMLKHATEPFPPYDDLEGKIPEKAYQIIRKMTQKDPAARYQTYSDLIADLERLRNELYSRCQLKIPRASRISPVPTFQSNHLFDLLGRIYCQEESGVVRMTWGPLHKKFLVLRNEVIFFESPQQDENLWTALVAGKLLRKEEVPTGNNPEESLNSLLFRQVFSPEDFQSIYRELMTSSLLQVFLWPLFEGEFFRAEIEHDAFCKIPLARILMEGARNLIPYETVRKEVPEDQCIVRTQRFESILETLNLLRAESFLASRVEGENTTLDTLQMLTGFPLEQITRFIYALKAMQAVEYTPISGRHHEFLRSNVSSQDIR